MGPPRDSEASELGWKVEVTLKDKGGGAPTLGWGDNSARDAEMHLECPREDLGGWQNVFSR